MAHATRQEQLTLLELAELDSRIARLDRDDARHPLRQKLGTTMNAIAARARDKSAAEHAHALAHEQLVVKEARVEKLTAEIAGKDAKLNAGVGLTSRDLLVLQSEIDALRAVLSEASDDEFAALENVEATEGAVLQCIADIEALTQQCDEDTAALEDAIGELSQERVTLRRQRDGLLGALGSEAIDAYEESRASGGYTVLAVHPNGTTRAGVELSPAEIARVKASPQDELYISDDDHAIIILLDS